MCDFSKKLKNKSLIKNVQDVCSHLKRIRPIEKGKLFFDLPASEIILSDISDELRWDME
jgi:hypothetical protein